ncbi:Na+/H+ antiporter NhaA [Pedomonas sp. V897]|uniref:Na+/H+ antiporter NhaA n=1 Tax=Pedomonas sp. V897 TaxID=3446482 RepID=UPI003EDE8A33
MAHPAHRSPAQMLVNFFRLEFAGGLLLLVAAAIAILMRNSDFAPMYEGFRHFPVTVGLSPYSLTKPLELWINDALMAVFFLLVGLEIKREILEGQLSSRDQITLPVVAAIAGMAAPALVYIGFNLHTPETLRGWAIPSATDIAFAICLFSLVGRRAPLSLKVLLTAIAVVDDMGAIVIIALFYTAELSLMYLAGAAVSLAILLVLNRSGQLRLWPYLLVGAFLWFFVFKSGLHATIAGVLTALTIPLRTRTETAGSPLKRLEHLLHPWVAFGILPVFAFANAGVDLQGLSLAMLLDPIPLGIAAGLFLGKQVGIFGSCWLLIKMKWVRMPYGAGWMSLYGMAILCGVGFTMSLFIGGLAFSTDFYQNEVRLGILTGSLISSLVGLVVLALAPQARKTDARAAAE